MLWPEGSTNRFPMRNHPWSHLLVTLPRPHYAPASWVWVGIFHLGGLVLVQYSVSYTFHSLYGVQIKITETDNPLKVHVRIVLGLTGTSLWNGGRRCFYISSGVPVLFPNSVEMFQLTCEAWKTRTDQQIQVWGIQNLFKSLWKNCRPQANYSERLALDIFHRVMVNLSIRKNYTLRFLECTLLYSAARVKLQRFQITDSYVVLTRSNCVLSQHEVEEPLET